MRSLTRHFGLKLFSVAAAFSLWLAYSGSRELTTSLPVSVQYRNIPKDLEISSSIVAQVHLILRGPAPLLSRLSAPQTPVVLDLSSVSKPGLNTFTISRSNVGLPSGVTLERAIPAQIQIRTETRISREVPVIPVFENIPTGMQVAASQVTPPRLTIIGPKSRIQAIASVQTDPIDLLGVSPNSDIRTTVFAADPQVHFTTSPSILLRVSLVPARPSTPSAPPTK